MYVVSSDGTMNTVSSLGDRWRFMSAIWYSYSKSLTARRPRMSSCAPTSRAKSTSRPLKLSHLDARLAVEQRRANELDALLDGEQRLLRRVGRDGDDEPVDELEAAVHEIFVSARDRIEAAGVDGDAHGREKGLGSRGVAG